MQSEHKSPCLSHHLPPPCPCKFHRQKGEWHAGLLVDNEIGWGVYGYKGYTPKAPRMSGVLPEDKQAKNQSKGSQLQ